ncbi:MAG: hypothetical protein L0Y80_10900 [Ignavibacteriae bacterium]|nr:hypothetical protein [Ignavibacteriota bacterium]
MSKPFSRLSLLGAMLLVVPLLLTAQTMSEAERPEDNLAPQEFTDIIKEAWTFLKDETDAFLKATEAKTEFETTPEFQRRVEGLRREYLAKTAKFSEDKKYAQREFGILFKANLVSYDADRRVYRVTSNTAVEIPYDIPWLDVSIDPNPLVLLADSIARGYRSTSMILKMSPALRYEAPMDLAKSVKSGETNLYFRVRVTFNMVQDNKFRNQARLTITAYHIQLFSRESNTIYWEEDL